MPPVTAKPQPRAKPGIPPTQSNARRSVNLSLRANTLDEARKLGLNISRIADEKLAEAVREEKGRRWLEENREAIEYHSKRIERDGMWNKDLISF